MGIASLSSHGRVLTDLKDNLVDRVSSAAAKTDISVELTQGLQAGQTRVLNVTSMVVGARGGADIVLMDEGVEERHVSISFTRSAFGLLATVEALEGPISVEGTPVAAGDQLTEIKVPFELEMGEASMIFRRPASSRAKSHSEVISSSQSRQGKLRRGRVDPMILMSVLGLLVLIFLGVVWQLLTDHKTFVVDINTPVPAFEQPAVPDMQWLETARAKISDYGFENTLRINVIADNIFSTAGQIPESQMSRFREFQGWYDSQSGAPSMVWEVTQTARLARLPNIGMVRYSAPPAVILISGDEVSIGEELIDGWILAGVDETTLTLERGQEAQLVDYRIGAE
jgi:hypothetical protein